MLGSPVNVVGTNKEDIKVTIPCKLVGLHEALKKNFDWICPENFLMKVVYQRVFIRDLQKLIWTQFNSLLKKTSAIDLNVSFDIT
jgi:hypothetical protein